MADNVSITEGSGKTVAADDVGGVLYQRVKPAYGADGAATDVSTSSPLPAQLRDSDGTDVGLSAKLGIVTETAPSTDTASSGLNGRLQRIAQRLTSIIALLPAALGANGGLKIEGVASGTAVPVSAASLPLPSGAATLAEQQTQSASLSVLDDWDNGASDGASVSGDVADDAADAGEPVKIGGKARTAERTAVAASDRVDGWFDTAGRLIARLNSLLEDIVSGNASNTDGSSTQVIAAQGSGVKTYITDVTITNTSSSNIYVELKDGSTVKWTFPVPANGGVTHHFASPIPGTANTAWNFDPSAAATTVHCSAAGFKSKI